MDSSDLDERQLNMMIGVVSAQAAYLGRLLRRMRARGFPGKDRLQMRVDMAHNDLLDLQTCLQQLRGMRERQTLRIPDKSSVARENTV